VAAANNNDIEGVGLGDHVASSIPREPDSKVELGILVVSRETGPRKPALTCRYRILEK
jgi:hypothetical protein